MHYILSLRHDNPPAGDSPPVGREEPEQPGPDHHARAAVVGTRSSGVRQGYAAGACIRDSWASGVVRTESSSAAQRERDGPPGAR